MITITKEGSATTVTQTFASGKIESISFPAVVIETDNLGTADAVIVIDPKGKNFKFRPDDLTGNATPTDALLTKKFLLEQTFFNGKAIVRSKGSGKFDADKPNCNVVDPDIKATDTIRISTAQDVDETFSVTAIADGTFTANRTVSGLNSLSLNATFTWFIE